MCSPKVADFIPSSSGRHGLSYGDRCGEAALDLVVVKPLKPVRLMRGGQMRGESQSRWFSTNLPCDGMVGR